MIVRDLIKKLKQTSLDNEVRIINSTPQDGGPEYTPNIYISFDDNGDVLLYDE